MPSLGFTLEGRNQVFQRLKPPCVALSQAALALSGPTGNVSAATRCLEDLETVLSSVTSRPNNLDEKLADYVFFPLSHVLKISQKVPVRCLELALGCLSILIEHGWRGKIQPQLAAQVLILCTLMAERTPKGLLSTESTDELQCNAIRCLLHLFEATAASFPTIDVFVAESNIPQLGQTISTVLTAIRDGGSTELQIVAVRTLQALVVNIATMDIQAGFLPGIVSALTKVLTPQTKQRRNHRVLVGALDILCHLFKSTLGDSKSSVSLAVSTTFQAKSNAKPSEVIDRTWLETAASQLRPAITRIVRLSAHDRPDVRRALSTFCFAVLSCQTTLENCIPLCLEALVTMASDSSGTFIEAELSVLLTENASISAALQGLSHDWAQSLPTRMQSTNEHSKVQHIERLNTAYTIASKAGADMTMIDRALATLLRDSVVATLQSSGHNQPAANGFNVQSLELSVSGDHNAQKEFGPLLNKHKGDAEVMLAIDRFAQSISSAHASSTFSVELGRALRQSHGETLIASFWLLFDATQAAVRSNMAYNSFLNMDESAPETSMAVLEDLYTFSLDVLGDSADSLQDPRMHGLALRTLALRAETAGVDFRFELIDALYPVLHALATPQDNLQQDGIVTLNIIAAACGYDSVKDMIVENVDYLTNAVALKLNAFDVSPQAPQVLLMMVRLAGASLLPYLEDTIDSIFAALEDYHGYPILVELLFRVLSVVAEEGSKAPQLSITNDAGLAACTAREEIWRPSDVSSVVGSLKLWAEEEQGQSPYSRTEREPHPRQPWKKAESSINGPRGEEEADGSDQEMMTGLDSTDLPPLPKTYNLLLKISELTQHYLPSASTSLRASLLTLIKTTTPAIARHENSFLPLINTLWPEVASRLDDSEQHIVATALDIIALLCAYAGDFMRSRITDMWTKLISLVRKTGEEVIKIAGASSRSLVPGDGAQIQRALQSMHIVPTDYSDTSTRLLWEAGVKALSAVVKCVPLAPHLFDDALEVLSLVLDDGDVRTALEQQNADAVWLALAKRNAISMPTLPRLVEGMQVQFASFTG